MPIKIYNGRIGRVPRWLIGLVVLLLAGCASGASGDAANGALLFAGERAFANNTSPTCITCHAVVPGEPAAIGTNLSNIGNRAATTVPEQSAEEYLRTAITAPDAFLAGGFQEGIMYRDYSQTLSEAEINDLIAYMLTLRSGQDQ